MCVVDLCELLYVIYASRSVSQAQNAAKLVFGRPWTPAGPPVGWGEGFSSSLPPLDLSTVQPLLLFLENKHLFPPKNRPEIPRFGSVLS